MCMFKKAETHPYQAIPNLILCGLQHYKIMIIVVSHELVVKDKRPPKVYLHLPIVSILCAKHTDIEQQ